MTSTNPNTTLSQTTIPLTTMQSGDIQASNEEGGSCNIRIPDYTTLRQQNIEKVNNYYNKLLSSYTSAYGDYAKQSKGTKNDQNYANTVLLPKYSNYNNQLINITQSMIDNVNQDIDLISSQKDELINKNRQINTIMNNITMLKDKDNEMSVLTGSRSDSLTSANEGLSEINFSTYIYIGIDVFCILLILGLIIYIVYSSFTNKRTNNLNNIYSNIAVNATG
jgi:hypothetical protein